LPSLGDFACCHFDSRPGLPPVIDGMEGSIARTMIITLPLGLTIRPDQDPTASPDGQRRPEQL
jgi:hypothetical protein